MEDCKIRSGYRVIGPNSLDGKEICWYFGTLIEANRFAEHAAGRLGYEFEVCKYLGSFKPKDVPVEFIASKD